MRRLRRFGFNRIKEGFDQLPTAICFFDEQREYCSLQQADVSSESLFI